MPVYSAKELETLTGIKQKNIHTYAGKRGKLVKNKNGHFDTTNQINYDFIETRRINGEPKKLNGTTKNKEQAPLPPVSQTEHQKVLQEKTKIELDIKRKELEKRDLELEQIRGETLDKEQTISIVKSYIDSLKTQLEQDIEKHIQFICSRNSIDSAKTGTYKKEVAPIINKASQSSIELLLKTFKD